MGKQGTPNRGRNGLFTPGGRGGPGRPPRTVEQRYTEAIREAITVADLIAVLRRCVAAAKKGDMKAAKLVLAYTVGLPVDTAIESRIQEIEANVARNRP